MPRYTTDLNDLEPFIQALDAELRVPAVAGPAPAQPGNAPTIIEEPSYLGRMGVTVVWDDWHALSGEVRGRVILEAYRRAFSEEAARAIGLAMGLTRDQYARMRAQAGV